MDIIHSFGYFLDTYPDIIQIFYGYLDTEWISWAFKISMDMIHIISILYPDRIQNIQILSMDTHLRIQKWIRIRKSTDSCIHGYYLDTTWIQSGYRLDMYPWIFYGYILDTTWIQIGYCLDMYPWIFHGYILDTNWIQSGHCLDMYPWIFYGYNLDENWIHFGYISMDISWIHFGNNVDT